MNTETDSAMSNNVYFHDDSAVLLLHVIRNNGKVTNK